jgi:hypothetical protein
MRALFLSSVCAVIVLLSACSSVDISSDYDSSANFDKLKTYQWHAPNEYNRASKNYLNNDILDQRIRENVNRELQAKGFQLKESGDVDFYVNYTVSTDDRVDVNTYNTYGGYAPGFRYGYYGAGPYRYGGVGVVVAPQTETQVNYYTQGTFLLDIVEADNKKLVWRGSAEGKLKERASQNEREEAAKEIIADVLANFPPK